MINPATLSVECAGADLSFSTADLVTTRALTNKDQREVLEFLEKRPIQNAVMSGFIKDNGIESKRHRGTFYGCHCSQGKLQGVALIGHAVLLDARSDDVLSRFAELAQHRKSIHMIMGEQGMVESFWKFYSTGGQHLRHSSREVLLELNQSIPDAQFTTVELRPARLDDLLLLVPVHAAMAMEESGVNPLDKDPSGFELRCRRRVEQGRVWVLIEGEELIFKADIVVDTPEVIYLEGIYVHPCKRGVGNGARCLAQLSNRLLRRTRSITVLVNDQRSAVRRFFEKLGFVARGRFETNFLGERTNLTSSRK